jgi:ATP/maltotriose-dependent transcriptional regulator MalT
MAAGCVAQGAGNAHEARRHLEDAVDLYRQSGAAFELARARIDLARSLRSLGQNDAAAGEAQRAIDLLTELKAELEISRARSLIDALRSEATGDGAPAASREVRAGLTNRELDVLRLVAVGLNNQQIGERLFVSEHTVHRHVANIFTKLSVSSRAAAVAQAARHGLLT